MIGETIGNYRVVSALGEGGMGQVYRAEHPRIGRTVAIKVLRAELSVNRRLVERLFDEALATNLIKHPSLVQIFDCGFHHDRAYLIMEYLEGQTLTAWVRAHPVTGASQAVCAIGAEIAAALEAAHRHDIVHRDLKPDNVFLLGSPTAPEGAALKVLDFGVAKLARAIPTHSTDSSVLLGSPAYMSPEQAAAAGTVDARTDIYSLGCILFELVTGRRVFLYEGWGQYIAAHQSEPAPRASSIVRGLDPRLDDLIARMLAKPPGDRPASMQEVEAELRALLEGPAVALPVSPVVPGVASDTLSRAASAVDHGRRARRGWVMGLFALGGVALAGGLAWRWWAPGGEPRPLQPDVQPAPVEIVPLPAPPRQAASSTPDAAPVPPARAEEPPPAPPPPPSPARRPTTKKRVAAPKAPAEPPRGFEDI